MNKESKPLKNTQRHEVVAGELMSRIFTGELKPGEKLPTEKELTRETGVDRTSLRVALKQLEGMQLLEIRQGDGIYVKDYLENAGLDFLRMLALAPREINRDDVVFNQYVFDELSEFWEFFFPQAILLASKKASPRDLKKMKDLLELALEHIDDEDMAAFYELESQELIAHMADNMVLMLLFNSSRPLREKMLKFFIGHMSQEDLQEYAHIKIKLFQKFSSGMSEDLHKLALEYKNVMISLRTKVKKKLGKEHFD